MMVGNVGSSNYYTMAQTAGKANGGEAPPDPSEIFDKVDIDGSGGLSPEEFQVLTDRMSTAEGDASDSDALFSTYDTDGDGILSEEETQKALEANRPEGPPPGGMHGTPPPAMSEIFSEADEDEDGVLNETETQTVIDMINEATGNDLDVEGFMAEYDTDGDGVLSQEETLAALEANRPAEPPPPEARAEEPEAASGTENFLSTLAAESYQDTASRLFSVSGESVFNVNTKA